MSARLADAGHDERIEIGAERFAVAASVDAEDARAAEALDFAAHRHFARRGPAQEVEWRHLEIDRAVEPDQGDRPDAAAPARGHPVEHERQHARAARVAADDHVRRAPTEGVMLDDAAQRAGRFIGRPARREVVGREESDDGDAAPREAVGDAAVDGPPAAVAGDHHHHPRKNPLSAVRCLLKAAVQWRHPRSPGGDSGDSHLARMPPLGGCVREVLCSARIPPVSGREEGNRKQRRAVFEIETGRGAGAAGTAVAVR